MDKIKDTSSAEENQRQFKPTFGALKNKNSIFILTAILCMFGWFSYQSMPREYFPEVVIPNILISTPYPGNSPVDIENLITRPIEKELKSLKGVKKMSSASYQDMSLIVVEFNTDVDVKQALQDTKDKVDKSLSELPDDLDTDPVVEDIDFADFPILNINLSGDFGLNELKEFAEDLQDKFEALPEVSEADIKGVDEREIKINADLHKMEANGVSFHDIETAISDENVTVSAGTLITDNTRRSIRTSADYTNMQQIENTIVKVTNGKVVYLKDVAEIEDGYEELSSISRLNNNPVVSLSISKKSGENLLAATDEIYKIISKEKELGNLPQGLLVTVTDDTSEDVRGQVSDLENSIIMGMLLVILILYLFMGLRNALFSGLAIPMSMFISFIILNQMGYTVNQMILFSLILALGMLVDNAIVVVENVYRLHEEGLSKLEATKQGVSEIAGPIISSTATTLAAFFPLLLWGGIMGEFMKYLPITLIIVLSSSLFVALILNPVFTASFVKIDNISKKIDAKKYLIISGSFLIASLPFYVSKAFGVLDTYIMANLLACMGLLIVTNLLVLKPFARWFQLKFLVALENSYEKTLRYALKGIRPLLFFLGTFVLMIVSIMFYFGTKPLVVFFPDNDPKSVYVTMELPLGTDIHKSNEISVEVEKIVKKTMEPYKDIIRSISTNVGSGKGGMFEGSRSANKSLTSISFVEYKQRDGVSTSKLMQELTKNFKGFIGAKIFVEKNSEGPPVGHPINVEVSGDDFEQLLIQANRIKQKLDDERIAGIEELKLDLDQGKPEMLINIDRDKVRRFGLSTNQVARALRNSLYGLEVSKFKDGEDEYDIMLRLSDKYRYDVPSLMNQKINVMSPVSNQMVQIPISAVTTYNYGSTYERINRIDNTRVVTIYSNVEEGFNANEINAKIREALANFEMPKGYTHKLTGEQEEQDETSAFLTQALLIALALITLILVTQFNSAVKPLIIMITVLFSTIGVFLGLGIFNMPFVILMTGIGIISLAGIVVNNGIVLVDYIDLLRKRKIETIDKSQRKYLTSAEEVDCIANAGKTRLRPVMLTAITTVLGLFPLAVGMNFDFFTLFSEFDPQLSFGSDSTAFWGPMSWTVIFGLSFATFLTLIIAPVMFRLSTQIEHRLYDIFSKK
ncbi:efflux RND transporter permease subunit [Labilibaculum sp. K2S]|uniref:efflux RND transporter permease subunit n=1 Tax=Labilibaculum sp. K2S TaxID=3056386 RepID=UPI0025A3827B|nr:efflux RND transporter permease subunit [Labilibaculum sp. K2S]MDM8160320.1 efflux RND transporter permease subunit [Labilibaculum sp. K2S]